MPPLTIDFTNADGQTVHMEGVEKFSTRSVSGGGIGATDGKDAYDKAQVYARGEKYGDEHLHSLDKGDSVTVDLNTGERLVVSRP